MLENRCFFLVIHRYISPQQVLVGGVTNNMRSKKCWSQQERIQFSPIIKPHRYEFQLWLLFLLRCTVCWFECHLISLKMQDWGYWHFKPLIVCFFVFALELNVSYNVKTRDYFLNCFIYIFLRIIWTLYNVPSRCDCLYIHMCLKPILIILLQSRIKSSCMWGVHPFIFRLRFYSVGGSSAGKKGIHLLPLSTEIHWEPAISLICTAASNENKINPSQT